MKAGIKNIKLLIYIMLFSALPLTLFADTDIEKVKTKIDSAIDKEIETQKITKSWENEKNSLTSQYERLLSKKKRLNKEFNKNLKLLSIEEKKHNEFIRKQNEVKRIRNELNILLENICIKLEEFINKDLPFHREERLARVSRIKNELLLSKSRPGEKYRQVFEALQIETDFGKTIEVYNKKINLHNQEKLVDILRIGRVSLFCLTPDKSEAAKYDPFKNEWISLDSKTRKEIEKGILTAKGEKTADLVKLPFGRIAR